MRCGYGVRNLTLGEILWKEKKEGREGWLPSPKPTKNKGGSMNNVATTLFLGKGYRVKKQVRKGNELRVYMEYEGKQRCPRCKSENLVKNGKDTKWRKKLHMSFGFFRVYLLFKRQRYKCKDCGKAFSQAIPILRKKERFTSFFKQAVIFWLIFFPFDLLSLLFGVSRRTLLKIAEEFISRVMIEELKDKERLVIGMDAHRFHRKDFALLLVEILSSLPFGLIQDKKKAFMDFLLSMPSEVREKIDEVVMDMTVRYRRAVEEILPHAKVVCDPFHLISYMNHQLMEEKRVIEVVKKRKIPGRVLRLGKEKLKGKDMERLEKILAEYPSLKLLYRCKEALRDMYRGRDIEKAEKILDWVIDSLKSYPDESVKKIGNTLSFWRQEILNYFCSRSTNGKVEGYNRNLKLLQRRCYGIRNWKNYLIRGMLSLIGYRYLKTTLIETRA